MPKKNLIHHLGTRRWSKIVYPSGCFVNISLLNYGVISPCATKAIQSSIQTDYGSFLKKSLTLLFSLTFFSPSVVYDTGFPVECIPQTEITANFKEKQLVKNLDKAHMWRLNASTFIYRSFQNAINAVLLYVNRHTSKHIKQSEVCCILMVLRMERRNLNRSPPNSYFANMFLMFVWSGHLL